MREDTCYCGNPASHLVYWKKDPTMPYPRCDIHSQNLNRRAVDRVEAYPEGYAQGKSERPNLVRERELRRIENGGEE